MTNYSHLGFMVYAGLNTTFDFGNLVSTLDQLPSLKNSKKKFEAYNRIANGFEIMQRYLSDALDEKAINAKLTLEFLDNLEDKVNAIKQDKSLGADNISSNFKRMAKKVRKQAEFYTKPKELQLEILDYNQNVAYQNKVIAQAEEEMPLEQSIRYPTQAYLAMQGRKSVTYRPQPKSGHFKPMTLTKYGTATARQTTITEIVCAPTIVPCIAQIIEKLPNTDVPTANEITISKYNRSLHAQNHLAFSNPKYRINPKNSRIEYKDRNDVRLRWWQEMVIKKSILTREPTYFGKTDPYRVAMAAIAGAGIASIALLPFNK